MADVQIANAVAVPDELKGQAGTIYQITPSSGPASGGYAVIITGLGLQNTVAVMFDTTPARVTYVDPSGAYVTCYAPPHPLGPVVVFATDVNNNKSNFVLFTYT